MKIKVDGAIGKGIGGAIGFIIFDHFGAINFAAGKSFQGICDSFTIECLAVRYWILLNKDPSSSDQFILEVLEFQDWLQREWIVDLKHVYREANHAADYLANLGRNTTRGAHEVHHDDCNLAYFIRYDCMGISEPRVIK
ncbi:hypothetical protein LINPERHAP2_LOCUS24129 [Linum perenne]